MTKKNAHKGQGAQQPKKEPKEDIDKILKEHGIKPNSKLPVPVPPSPPQEIKPTADELKKPFVSVLCVTYNRRPFIPMFLEMVRNQDYPQSRIEVIIVDDGTDPIEDVVTKENMPNVRYVRVKEKMPLGKKRNYANSLISNKTKYIIPMDDDDVMMSERISHSVEMLEKNPQALCAGSSEMFLYFKHIKKLYKFGPYMVNPEDKAAHEAANHHRNRIGAPLNDYLPVPTQHATNGTFAYRRELLNITRYNETACLAEEKEFLKGYTIPMVQLNPFKCILCMSHEHNTFDKRKLLENMNPMFVAESNRDVDSFFKLPKEAHIKEFFLEKVDKLLDAYDPGLPKHKPDVLKQIKVIEAERDEMMRKQQQQQQQQQQQPAIVIQQPGQPPQNLSMEDVVNLMRQQQAHIDYLTRTLDELQNSSTVYRRKCMEHTYKELYGTPASHIQDEEKFTRIEIQI